MPKIIENVREDLIAETKAQIVKNGYAKTTMRSIASACNLAVGTVYNYFPSKDMLIATFMLEDWSKCLEKMERKAKKDKDNCLKYAYDGITEFVSKHKALFEDEEAKKSFAISSAMYHKYLRKQVSAVITPAFEGTRYAEDGKTREFLTEAILSYTLEGVAFDEIEKIVEQILIKE